MPRKKDELALTRELTSIRHREVRWSNLLIKSALDCSLVEKRALYFISIWVKENFTERNLGVPDNWKDLYIHMTDADLGLIGGRKNVPRTYEALKSLMQRVVELRETYREGNRVSKCMHWVDFFKYNEETGYYDLRISPEILPYLINVKENFTNLDMGEAMTFTSKYTQKLYEFISMYSGNYRYTNKKLRARGFNCARNIVPVSMDQFRELFSLREVRDARTDRLVRKAKYGSFHSIQENILRKAQQEMYLHHAMGTGCIWFDFQAEPECRRGRKVDTIYLFIYTRNNPKKGPDRLWQRGDEPLSPYVSSFEEAEKLQPEQRMHANPAYGVDDDAKEMILAQKLGHYFDAAVVGYYMRMTRQEMMRRKYNRGDVLMNMIQVIADKERQPKFKSQTIAYQRLCLERFVFTENLQRDFRWSIPPARPALGKLKDTGTARISRGRQPFA